MISAYGKIRARRCRWFSCRNVGSPCERQFMARLPSVHMVCVLSRYTNWLTDITLRLTFWKGITPPINGHPPSANTDKIFQNVFFLEATPLQTSETKIKTLLIHSYRKLERWPERSTQYIYIYIYVYIGPGWGPVRVGARSGLGPIWAHRAHMGP